MNNKTGLTLLIIDGSPEERSTYRRILHQDSLYRYQIFECDTAIAAQALCEPERPDVILWNWDLPDEQGLALLQSLRKTLSIWQTAILVITESGTVDLAVQAMKSGAQDYLDKTKMTPETLRLAIHHAMERVRLNQELQRSQEQQQLIGAIALQTRQSLKLQEILDTATTEVRQFLKADRVLVLQFRPGHPSMILAESGLPGWRKMWGQEIHSDCFPESSHISYSQGKKQAIADIHHADLPDCLVAFFEQWQVKAVMVVSMMVNQQLWGLLVAHQCSAPRLWQPTELELLEQLSVQLAIAIQQSSDYEQAQLELAERRRTESILRESEARFRHTFEQAAVGLAHVSLMGEFLRLNHTFCHITGYTAEQLQTLTFQEITHPDDLVEYLQLMQQLLTGKITTHTREQRYIRRDRTVIWINLTISLVRDATGRPQYLITVVENISDRKHSEAERQQAEQALQTLNQDLEARVAQRTADLSTLSDRLALALKAGTIGIWDWDLVHPPTWDDTMYQLYGLSGGNLSAIDHDCSRPIHPDDRAAVADLLQASLRGEQEFDTEFRIVRTDGTLRHIKASALVQRNDQGEPQRMIGINYDITERKRAEHLIRLQAERETLLRQITLRIRESLDLQTIFETAVQEIRQFLQADRVGIFRFDPDSGFDDGEFVAESVAPGFMSVVTIKIHDHCFGDRFAHLYQEGRIQATDDVDNAGLQDCHKAVLSQFEVRANLILPLLNGENLWGLLCVHQCDGPRAWQLAEIDLTQQITHQLAIAIQQASLFEQLQQELSERQQAEIRLTEINAQLAITNEHLARATRLKDEFLANMSHELRTPLNAILGMTESLQEPEIYGPLSDRQIQAIQTIENSGSHLLELINDVLDVAKIESGQVELNLAPTPIPAICYASLAFIKPQALKKQIQLDLKLPSSLPELCLDERRMRQVLINLLNNAVKFTPEGGRITLEVSFLPPQTTPNPLDRPAQPYLRLAIIDTGIGIAAEYFKKLFQPFVQIDSALNRQYAGTGLGLALVKRIVELHGGQVGLTSEVGVGSCFTLDLPYTAEVDPRVDPVLSPMPSLVPDSPDAPASPLILLVEDNEANVSTVADYLGVKGYRILWAPSGEEAIALAQSQQPDLILMDIQMPGMDGLEAMQQIRRDPNLVKVPIIALTALAMPGDQERCLAAGANDYLTKPVRLKQLLTTMQQLLATDTTSTAQASSFL